MRGVHNPNLSETEALLSLSSHALFSSQHELATACGPVEWCISDHPVDYASAVDFMENRVCAISEQRAQECLWLLEHPPLYTAGTSARAADLLSPDRFPVHTTGRGGQYTYHGPGQRVGYVMLNLDRRGQDIRKYITQLEDWMIETLKHFQIKGERRAGRIGIWVDRGAGREDKIAAVGVRVRKWVTFHGVALNLDPDLSHFDGIVPCGIQGHGVTSLHDLGILASRHDLDVALQQAFCTVFGGLRADSP